VRIEGRFYKRSTFGLCASFVVIDVETGLQAIGDHDNLLPFMVAGAERFSLRSFWNTGLPLEWPWWAVTSLHARDITRRAAGKAKQDGTNRSPDAA